MADPQGSVFWDHFVNGVPEQDLVAEGWEMEGVGKDTIPGWDEQTSLAISFTVYNPSCVESHDVL
jgi:hypothetical protein